MPRKTKHFIDVKDRRLGLPKLWIIRQLDKVYRNFIQGFAPANMCCTHVIENAFTFAQENGTLSKGDYYEFGLFKGYSLWYAQKTANVFGEKKMKFYGFDSFEGLPVPEGIDNTDEFYPGQFACSKEQVVENITSHQGDMKTITLIEGFYDRSLKKELIKQYGMRKASIIFIDCDLYSSTKDVMEFIKPLLMKHTLLLFDDWNTFNGDMNKGESKAFSEFKKQYPNITFEKDFAFCWHGQAFRVKDIR
jgi:O-methyltransferase